MSGLKIHVQSSFDAVRLVYRSWRASREMGVPFEDIFEIQMATLKDVMWDDYYRKKELHARSQTCQARQEPEGDA